MIFIRDLIFHSYFIFVVLQSEGGVNLPVFVSPFIRQFKISGEKL